VDNYPRLKSNFRQALSNKTGFNTNFFDFVISVEAAQPFHNFLSFARESFRVLKVGGSIAVTTFFFPNKHCKRKIKEIIPPDISGIHRTITISKAKNCLLKAGFQNIEICPIGSKVFAGFCKWASQAMSKKNHTPKWIESYDKQLLDYYLIRAKKGKEV
jgi:hypothetical protein